MDENSVNPRRMEESLAAEKHLPSGRQHQGVVHHRRDFLSQSDEPVSTLALILKKVGAKLKTCGLVPFSRNRHVEVLGMLCSSMSQIHNTIPDV